MAGKRQSFRDILRHSFPVNVDGLLRGAREDHVDSDATVTGHTVSLSDTVSHSDFVELTSNYFLIDADVFDLLPKIQTPFEQIIYLHLYRGSYGRKSQSCFVGLKTLTDTCQLSKNTVRKALEGLEEKGHIRRLERFNQHNHKGTLYRVFLPCELADLQSKTTFTLISD
jgi:hypothetical protein